MLRMIHEVGGWFGGIMETLTILGTFPLSDEVGMGAAFFTHVLSLRKGGYVNHLHW